MGWIILEKIFQIEIVELRKSFRNNDFVSILLYYKNNFK